LDQLVPLQVVTVSSIQEKSFWT